MTAATTPLGDYLRARRAEITPESVGFPPAARRRVTGLRREEVAVLAGISTQYYLRLEQGLDRQPSSSVIAGLSRALRLGRDGTAYLTRLAAGERAPHTPVPDEVRAEALRLLDLCGDHAAFLADRNFDLLASNDAARALSGGTWTTGANLVDSMFGPWLRSHLHDWEECARRTVAAWRFRADPADPRLRELVADLSREHPDFRQIWDRHEARPAYVEPFRQHVDGVGEMALRVHTFRVHGTPGWTLTAVSPDAPAPLAEPVRVASLVP